MRTFSLFILMLAALGVSFSKVRRNEKQEEEEEKKRKKIAGFIRQRAIKVRIVKRNGTSE
jgi:hypothetical protein